MRRREISTLLLVATWLVAGPARADIFDGTDDFGFLRAEAFVTLGALPPLALNGDDTPRRVVGAPTPASALVWHGVGAAIAVRADFLTWDVISFRYSASNAAFWGPSTANGQTFNVAMDGIQTLEIGVPLCGVPSGFAVFLGQNNAWKLAFAVDVGFEHLWASAVASSASGKASASIDDWSGYMRMSASACRSIGRWTGDEPLAWFCLTASPKLLDGNGASGVSLGARIEL